MDNALLNPPCNHSSSHSTDPFDLLQQLKHDRFALARPNTTHQESFLAVREFLYQHYTPTNDSQYDDFTKSNAPLYFDNHSDDFWLIGTDGCHLCESMKLTLDKLSQTQNLPAVRVLEILDFDDEIAVIFAPYIPVLITKNTLLTSPFGIMDVLSAQYLSNEK